MSVDLGVAEGHIVLDTSGFISSLKTAQQSLGAFSSDVALKIGGAFSALGSTIQSFGNALNTAISRPLQNLAKSALDEMASFEDGLNRAAVISGTTGENFERLSEKALEMGRTTKFTATQATEALNYMAMAGWDSSQMMDGLEGIMNLAAASGEDLASVSDIVTDALTAMGLKASDSAHFADVLTVATLKSNTTVSMLGEAFRYVAPVAGQMGYSIEDLALALGTMANSGIKASQAGTALRGALVRMTIAPGQVKEAMDELGITMYDTAGNAKPLGVLLDELRTKFSGLTQKEAAYYAGVIFGRTSMAGMLTILKANQKEWDRLRDVLSKANGESQRVAREMQQTFLGQLTVLQSVISGIILQFQKDVLPALTNFVRYLQDIGTKFTQLDAGTRKVVLALVAFGAAIGPLVAGFGGLLATVGGAIASLGLLAVSFEAIAALSAAAVATFAGWGAAIAAAIAVASGAMVTFTAAFADLMANSEDFRKQFMVVIGDIKIAFVQLWDDFRAALDEFAGNNLELKDQLYIVWIYIKNAIAPVLLWIVAEVKNSVTLITTILSGFLSVIDGIIKIFKGNFSEGLNAIFTGIAKLISSFFISLIDQLGDSIKAIWGFFTSFNKSSKESADYAVEAKERMIEAAFKAALGIADNAEKVKKTEEAMAKEHAKQAKQYADTTTQMYDELGINTDEADKEVAEKSAKMGFDMVTNFSAGVQQLPEAIGRQRVPMTVEVDKMRTDLVSSGDMAAAGFVGVIDANLSQLEGTFNDYLSDALDVVDDFTASLSDSGTSSAAAFSGALTTELKKMPGAFSTQLTAALNTVKTWSVNMSNEAKTMATTFNRNAAETAADLTAQLNTKLTASLNVAGTWVQKMGAKGKDGAKLFLDYMLAAVDEQGKEIEKFGRDIAEHLTIGIEGHSEWIKKRLKKAYLKIINDMEVDLGITSKATGTSAASAANVAYASDYSLGYSAGSGAVAQRAGTGTVQSAAAMPSTIIFNSPVAIDEIEASRLLRKTQQDMLLGF